MIDWYSGETYYSQDDAVGISDLLLGRRVVKVYESKQTMLLDDGTVLKVEPNEGCVCGAGDYRLEHLEAVNNAITDVELVSSYEQDGDCGSDQVYSIYVYANGMRHELLRVVGDDGNGYYGTGYRLYVRQAGKEEEE